LKQRFKKTKANKPLMRITKNDIAIYDRLNRNVKAKINRVQKNFHRDLSGEIKTDFKLDKVTRATFNAWVEQAKSFTNRSNTNYQFKKNKNGVVITGKEYNEIKRNIEIDRRNAEKRRKKEPVNLNNVYLKKPKDEFGVMGRFNFDAIQSRKVFEERLENSRKRISPTYYDDRIRIMRENYIEKLYDVFNSDAEPLVAQILEMDLNDFYDLYLREERMQFDFVYTAEHTKELAEDYGEELAYYIERYKEGHYNDGLRNFPNTW
jgi:hypothetical protein